MSGGEARYLSAREAAAELNVSRATLYAYVSRGLIRSEPSRGSRARLYAAEDVAALRARKSPDGRDAGAGRDAGGARGTVGGPLNFGPPVLESAITLIEDGRLYYRGRDAAALARHSSLEAVAGLLWQAGDHDPFAAPPPPPAALSNPDARPADVAPDLAPDLAACIASLAAAERDDIRAYNFSRRGIAATGARILRLIAGVLAARPPGRAPVHRVLADGWGLDAAQGEPLRAALVLCADHEFNASAFAVRVIASTGATPYGAVIGGLAALRGPLHGGQSGRALALLREAEAERARGGAAADAVAARLRRGERLPGFGHPLYPEGDARAKVLLSLLRDDLPASTPDGSGALLREVEAAARDYADQHANIDFALAAAMHAWGLGEGEAMACFAVGRTVGWIAHAGEQYRLKRLIRPRARYVGPQPQPAQPAAKSH